MITFGNYLANSKKKNEEKKHPKLTTLNIAIRCSSLLEYSWNKIIIEEIVHSWLFVVANCTDGNPYLNSQN